MKKLLAHSMIAVLLAAGLAGCGGGDPVAYTPVAYGQNSQCYYVDSPQEAIALQQAGLCQRSWVPTLMPLLWHEMYYPYYSSPAYYGSYVPAASRTVYVQHTHVFYNANKSAIQTAEKQAKYKGSNGKTYTGNKIKSSQFGNGKKGFGGGSRTCGLSPLRGEDLNKGGGYGGGSRGGSTGGSSGGSRSGSTKSGSTKSGSTRTRSGC